MSSYKIHKLKIGVLMGGPSSEHEVSLKTGQKVIENLDKEKYEIRPILITKEKNWIVNKEITKIKEALAGLDLVFIALHGEYGEDGQIQAILDYYQIPYTGSGVSASKLGMNKFLSRQAFKSAGLKTPFSIYLEKKTWLFAPQILKTIKKHFSGPIVVKPNNLGSSVGISIVNSLEDLEWAVRKAFQKDNQILLEEYISGQEATCGIIENFKEEKYFALPVTEIIPPEGRFFDYEVKYDGSTQEITPARFSPKLTQRIQKMAKLAHQALGCQGYSRADFIISKNQVYLLEVNTLPGLTETSLLPQAAQVAGLSFPQLLDKIIQEALR